MFKRLAPLAMVMALVTFALPAGAQAEGWTTEGNPLQNPGTITQTGSFKISSARGGVECEVITMFTLDPGTPSTTGTVDTFQVDGVPTNVCVTTGGYKLLGCKVEAFQGTELPWTIHWRATGRITFTTRTIDIGFESCLIHRIIIRSSEGVDANVAESEMNAIAKDTLTGEAPVEVEGVGEETVTVSGSAEVTEGSGMFGL